MCSFLFQAAKNPFCFVFIFSKQLPLNYFGGLHFNNPSVPSSRPPPKKSPRELTVCTPIWKAPTGVVVEKIELNPSKRLIWTGHRFDLTKVYEYSRPVNSRNHLEAVEILNAVLNTVGRRLVSFLNGTFYNLRSGVLFFLFLRGSAKCGEQAKGKMQLLSLAPQRKRKKDRLTFMAKNIIRFPFRTPWVRPKSAISRIITPRRKRDDKHPHLFHMWSSPETRAKYFFFFIPQIL